MQGGTSRDDTAKNRSGVTGSTPGCESREIEGSSPLARAKLRIRLEMVPARSHKPLRLVRLKYPQPIVLWCNDNTEDFGSSIFGLNPNKTTIHAETW